MTGDVGRRGDARPACDPGAGAWRQVTWAPLGTTSPPRPAGAEGAGLLQQLSGKLSACVNDLDGAPTPPAVFLVLEYLVLLSSHAAELPFRNLG